ncbi:caspase family protein [Cellulomonas endometrii]|uniref:caspase family protein n=1 Tax=Cellulomonas endometrii TaxID=3036301 RepID=UPI0024AE79B3|nr:caspase family protein [Cellulomonas endometrii]
MARAVVLVGVARTGGRFPELPAVPEAVAAVRDWARAQGVPDDLVLTFADTDGSPVRGGDVLAGVRSLVQRGDVDQLVVYFSGHGVNNGNSEFWLLPGAPEDGSQAVNVSLTAWQAERLPVRHVVLVSDACRTAASTVQELGIQGVSVVPNLPPHGPAAAVDVFYACALGDPAYEVKDAAVAGAAYRALFTTVLVRALRGELPDVVTPDDGRPEPRPGLVRPWPLKRALPGLVAAHLAAVRAPLDLVQTPDARLSSDPDVAWLSLLEPWPPAAEAAADAGAPGGADTAPTPAGDAPAPVGAAPTPAPAAPAGPAVRAAAAAADRLAENLAGAGDLAVAGGTAPSGPELELELAVAPGPPVTVRGARAVRLERLTDTAALVVLDSGCCAVLPVLPGRVTVALVEDGALVDCAMPWDPAAGSPDGRSAVGLARRARSAAWSRFGLSLDDDDEADDGPDDDPLTVVYRAWALHDRGRRAAAAALAEPGTDGARLFDVTLLAQPGGVADPDDPRWASLLTPVPLLARGWSLLPAAPEPVQERARAFPPRLPSHWTLFAAADAGRVAAAVLGTPPEESP